MSEREFERRDFINSVKKKRRKISVLHHPDKNLDKVESANKKQKEINSAYDYLVHLWEEKNKCSEKVWEQQGGESWEERSDNLYGEGKEEYSKWWEEEEEKRRKEELVFRHFSIWLLVYFTVFFFCLLLAFLKFVKFVKKPINKHK